MLSLVHDHDTHAHIARNAVGHVTDDAPDLDELCRLAARQMIAVALEAERRAYLQAHAHAYDEDGKRLVVGNGYARQRQITTAAGRVQVKAPRRLRARTRRVLRLGCGPVGLDRGPADPSLARRARPLVSP
jgi:hypothetical protein